MNENCRVFFFIIGTSCFIADIAVAVNDENLSFARTEHQGQKKAKKYQWIASTSAECLYNETKFEWFLFSKTQFKIVKTLD